MPQADVIRSSGFRALKDDLTSLRRTVLLGCLFVLGPWAWIGFPLLSTAVMIQKGFHAGDSLLFAGLSMFGPTLGIAATAPFVDRIPRRLALVACAGVMIAAGVGFATGTDLVWLIAVGFVFNLTSAVYSSILSLYAAEILPTHLRASSTAGVWALGRLVSAFVPVLLLPLLGSRGPIAMFAVISLALLASLSLVTTAGPPGRERLPVE
jgi:putative MFS transporter